MAKAERMRRQAQWDTLMASFPGRLDELLASPVFGRAPGRDLPPEDHGVYLFSERHGSLRHLYVGRCGLTERAKRAGKGYSNFLTRYNGHTGPGRRHSEAAFAWRLTIEAVGKAIEQMPATRKDRAKDEVFDKEFSRQKERVTTMDFRVVTLPDPLESYLFEAYAATILRTPYNSFAVS